jgi:class 3 adenylate cyclase
MASSTLGPACSRAQEQAIVGETPNLAARLQGIAEPNTVVIAEATRRLLVNIFELEDLGAKDLKGITGPVRSLRNASKSARWRASLMPAKRNHSASCGSSKPAVS